jgi:hypothetical protein
MLDLATQALLPRPSLSFLLGPWSSKKTWLALDLAVCTASGHPWLGQEKLAFRRCEETSVSETTKQSPCLPTIFIDEYHGPSEMHHRIRQVFQVHQVSPDFPFHHMSLPQFDFADFNEIESITNIIRPVSPGLIILDQLHGFPRDLTPRQMLRYGPLIANLRRLASSANAAILVLLHIRRRRTGLADALLALGADHVLGVDSPFGESWLHLRTIASSGSPPISLTVDLPLPQYCHNKIWTDPKFRGLSLSSDVPKPPLGAAGFAVLNCLAEVGQSTSAQVVENVSKGSSHRILTLIKELRKDGYIYRVNNGGRGVKALYALTPAGRCLV